MKAGHKLDFIEGFVRNGGESYLKISTKAVPEDGKANGAILKLLSKSWKIQRVNLEILMGLNSSYKVLLIKNTEEEALKDIFASYITNYKTS